MTYTVKNSLDNIKVLKLHLHCFLGVFQCKNVLCEKLFAHSVLSVLCIYLFNSILFIYITNSLSLTLSSYQV